ncbi:General amino acid permease AGP2 [Fusarium oxysporum f. sp. albedinis]|nr:General amino acid permease AGP2 [Fusarium oxysporum f. sp. albedinis]
MHLPSTATLQKNAGAQQCTVIAREEIAYRICQTHRYRLTRPRMILRFHGEHHPKELQLPYLTPRTRANYICPRNCVDPSVTESSRGPSLRPRAAYGS